MTEQSISNTAFEHSSILLQLLSHAVFLCSMCVFSICFDSLLCVLFFLYLMSLYSRSASLHSPFAFSLTLTVFWSILVHLISSSSISSIFHSLSLLNSISYTVFSALSFSFLRFLFLPASFIKEGSYSFLFASSAFFLILRFFMLLSHLCPSKKRWIHHLVSICLLVILSLSLFSLCLLFLLFTPS